MRESFEPGTVGQSCTFIKGWHHHSRLRGGAVNTVLSRVAWAAPPLQLSDGLVAHLVHWLVYCPVHEHRTLLAPDALGGVFRLHERGRSVLHDTRDVFVDHVGAMVFVSCHGLVGQVLRDQSSLVQVVSVSIVGVDRSSIISPFALHQSQNCPEKQQLCNKCLGPHFVFCVSLGFR